MKPSLVCEAVVKHFESCLKRLKDGRLEAYADPAHGWKVATIGWGSIYNYNENRPVKQGDVIDQATADNWFSIELEEKSSSIIPKLDIRKVTQNQFDAFVSFAYNAGIGNFSKSSILKRFLLGDINGAADAFLMWNKAGGKILPGLTRRREAERALFLGNYEELSTKTYNKIKVVNGILT